MCHVSCVMCHVSCAVWHVHVLAYMYTHGTCCCGMMRSRMGTCMGCAMWRGHTHSTHTKHTKHTYTRTARHMNIDADRSCMCACDVCWNDVSYRCIDATHAHAHAHAHAHMRTIGTTMEIDPAICIKIVSAHVDVSQGGGQHHPSACIVLCSPPVTCALLCAS